MEAMYSADAMDIIDVAKKVESLREESEALDLEIFELKEIVAKKELEKPKVKQDKKQKKPIKKSADKIIKK